MASNDMNSSDDPIDKSLRDHFQQVFDDFEVQPSASLTSRIWQRLNVPARKRRPYGVLILGVLLLIGTGLYIRSYHALVGSYEAKIQQATVAEPVGKDQSNKARKESEPGSFYSHHFSNTTGASSAPIGQATVETKSKDSHRPDDQLVRPVSATGRKLRLAQSKRQEASRRLVNNRRSTRSSQAFPETLAGFSAAVSQTDKLAARSAVIRGKAPEITSATPLTLPSESAELVEHEAVSWESLRSLALRPIGGMGSQISRNVQLPVAAASPSEQPKTRTTPVRWLVGVAPLSTYQLMTVVAKPDAYVQRVDAPSAFSGPTWGYQLSGGVAWRTFDFQLSFGQIRRWAYYDLATDVYQIRPIGVNKYQITSLDQPVAENVSLTMLGASINKQYRLGGVHSRYVARIGGQTSYVPASNQTLIWAKAALGLTLPFQRVYQLQFGPTVEYGFSRLWSNERQLIIHPYLIGAAITIRPTKP
ncbi:hypothetical protein [Spirosoma jeollabukense]